jgi:hypothetical protein
MLKQFAPKVVMPPSPKNIACINSAIETESIEAHGPKTTAAAPTPTACPVVPPGRGTLNIMITKQNALATASSGTSRVLSSRLTRAKAPYQNGIAMPYKTAQVEGLR